MSHRAYGTGVRHYDGHDGRTAWANGDDGRIRRRQAIVTFGSVNVWYLELSTELMDGTVNTWYPALVPRDGALTHVVYSCVLSVAYTA